MKTALAASGRVERRERFFPHVETDLARDRLERTEKHARGHSKSLAGVHAVATFHVPTQARSPREASAANRLNPFGFRAFSDTAGRCSS